MLAVRDPAVANLRGVYLGEFAAPKGPSAQPTIRYLGFG